MPYPAKGYEGASLKTSGCGPVCVSMLVETLKGEGFTPEAAAGDAIKAGARVSGGTDMKLLSSCVARDFGLEYEHSDDIGAAVQALRRGGMVICNAGGDRGNYKGVFSDGGHYLLACGMAGDFIMLADPGIYEGKYDREHRRRAMVEGGFVYAQAETVDEDCESRSPRYYIFYAGT